MFGFLSSATLVIFPILWLPCAAAFSYNSLLNTCFILASFHLLLSLFKFISKNKLEIIHWMFEIPALICYAVAAYTILPDDIITILDFVFQWAGPIIVTLEGVQCIRIIMSISNSLVEKLHSDEERQSIYKGIILSISVIAYMISIYIIFTLYNNPNITIALASYLSSISTILVGGTLFLIFYVEGVVISDVAMVSLLTLFFIRNGFLAENYEGTQNIYNSQTIITPLDYFGDFIYSSASYFTGTSSTSSSYSIGSFQFTKRLYDIFSINGIINLVISLIAVTSPFFQFSKFNEEMGDVSEEIKINSTSNQKINIIGSVLVICYGYSIATIVGYVPSIHSYWWILESFLIISFYIWRLHLSITQSEEDKYINFKED